MAEKTKVEVPIVLVGEPPALKIKENMLVQDLNSLTVECFPDKIPVNVELDLSSLTEKEQTIRVGDIVLAEEVTVLNAPELMVVKISSRPVEKVVVEEVVAEEMAEAPEEEAKEEELAPELLSSPRV